MIRSRWCIDIGENECHTNNISGFKQELYREQRELELLPVSVSVGLKNRAAATKVIEQSLDPGIQTHVPHLICSQLYHRSEQLAVYLPYPQYQRVSPVGIFRPSRERPLS
jgi:hypothetical protein